MKLRIVVLSLFFAFPNQSSALFGVGDVVFDPSVFGQTAMSAIESVTQTIKQVQQYETQLQQYMTQIQQYENMVQNTVAPAAYVWDQANATIGKVMGYVNTISQYQSTAGNLDSYLAKFQNTSYYRSSPCYSASGCSTTDKQTISDNQATSSAAQKIANDAVLRTVEQQQAQLTADAAQLASLQSSAQGASGQMQAIGYANQLASSEVNQLMQIRAILIAQQAAAATRAEAVNDRESQEQAGSDLFRSGSYTKSSGQGWGF